MTMKKSPTWDVSEDITIGTKVLLLGQKYRTTLEARLQPGTLEHLQDYLTQLNADTGGTATSQVDAKAATMDKHVSLEVGASLVHSIREAIKKNINDKVVVKAFGVGTKSVTQSQATVVKALEVIQAAAAKYPDQTKLAGILPADLAEVAAAQAALGTKRTSQADKQLTAKQATVARVKTQLFLEDAVDQVIGAAGLAFRTQRDLLQLFLDVIPAHSVKPAKPAEPKK